MKQKDPPTFLVLHCVSDGAPCASALPVPFEIAGQRELLVSWLHEHGEWILSALKPVNGKVFLAPLCATCAKRIYPQAMLDEGRRRVGGAGGAN